jgi:hypothetical protein
VQVCRQWQGHQRARRCQDTDHLKGERLAYSSDVGNAVVAALLLSHEAATRLWMTDGVRLSLNRVSVAGSTVHTGAQILPSHWQLGPARDPGRACGSVTGGA